MNRDTKGRPKWISKLLTLAFGCVLAFGLIEIFLRIHEPFGFRTRGDKIILAANRRSVYKNSFTDRGLDPVIINQRNSIGFRGEDFPKESEKYYKILTVGGSTTECFVLTDGKTWPDLLGKSLKSEFSNIWLNNAGLDGHSTFGHLILMRDHILKLKPDMVLFLAGINDVGRTDLRLEDQFIRRKPTFVEWLAFHSEVCSSALNFHRNLRARRLRVTRGEFVNVKEKRPLDVPESEANRLLDENRETARLFGERIRALVEICRTNAITPVPVTQPSLYACGVTDPATGVDLSSAGIAPKKNGCLGWRLIELYNDQTRRVAKELGVTIVDLSQKMPHDSSLYLDWYHYNNPGAEKVAQIVHEAIRPVVALEEKRKSGQRWTHQ